jgi:hypothetical protein
LKKAHFPNLIRELSSIDWPVLLKDNKNANDSYNIFVEQYKRVCDLWIPKSNNLDRKIQSPWTNGPVGQLISKKKRLWILVQQTRSQVKSVLDEYKLVRSQIKKATKRSVIDYENSITNDKKTPNAYTTMLNRNRKPRRL